MFLYIITNAIVNQLTSFILFNSRQVKVRVSSVYICRAWTWLWKAHAYACRNIVFCLPFVKLPLWRYRCDGKETAMKNMSVFYILIKTLPVANEHSCELEIWKRILELQPSEKRKYQESGSEDIYLNSQQHEKSQWNVYFDVEAHFVPKKERKHSSPYEKPLMNASCGETHFNSHFLELIICQIMQQFMHLWLGPF